jgi:hypothetical protein
MLNGKPVYLVDFYPYGPKDKLVMFQRPRGVKEASGKGSVKASATLLRGTPPSKPIFSNTGAVDDIISANGKGIKVTSVKDTTVQHKRKSNKPFRMPKMVEQEDGIVYSPKTGRGHLKA